MIMKVNFYNHTFLQFRGNQKPSYSDMVPNLQDYIDAGRVKESDIKGIAGRGRLSVVLDLGEQEVLKCSLENPLEFRTHNSSFDIPFLSPVEKFGQTYFVREAKADTKKVTQQDCINVIRRLYETGYEPSADLDQYKLRQVGIYKGKPYLLDTSAAVPQPDRFLRFVYDFCTINNRVLISRKVDPLDFSFAHIDETPRPNFSFKRGLAKMWNMMKTNMKYGKKPFSLKYTLALLIMK